ncbi:4Fe-4S binding protein [candidate division KSB1 bacterium]|nr:4Fe-4S binding protein [candidate division KSB1 bacterium]
MVPVVTTIETKCKRCYSCIRNCPAKAIRVIDGQAKVIPERCIACGYCVKVCSQNAKKILDGIERTEQFFQKEKPTIAVLAPSFPAAFHEVKPGQVVAGLKEIGFSQVMEVAFGADLVAREYQKLIKTNVMPIIISSACPAIVNFIEKHYPDLILFLAPIVSPMIAIGRVIKNDIDPNARVVFIGPCIAKKKEMNDPKTGGVIDEVVTFEELRKMFMSHHIDLARLESQPFDGPHPGMGKSFPLSGGLLKASQIGGDILDNDIVTTEGRERVIEIIHKVHEGKIEAHVVDILFCEGCINGPKMANDLSVFVRKDKVVHFLRESVVGNTEHESDLKLYEKIYLKRDFTRESLLTKQPTPEEIKKILEKTGKYSPEDELNCGSCGYPTCREKAVAVVQGLAEAEMCLPFMIEKLKKTQDKLTVSNEDLRHSLDILRKTQQQLIQSEKMASVGQLAAGVAHELNNPLGGIMIYSSLLLDKAKRDLEEAQDLERIVAETERCRKIVRGLLDFSRQTRMEAVVADLNKILKNTLALVARQALFIDIRVIEKLQTNLPPVFVDVGQIQQVFLNIILNAAEAMEGKGCLNVETALDGGEFIQATIGDTGPGIPTDLLNKIFDPFFTTKPPGKGTGLGLAIAYGIVQKHKGDIVVASRKAVGTTFIIKLPTVASDFKK